MKSVVSKNGFVTTKQRSQTMSKIKSNDTVAEIILRKALWYKGYRYTLKNKKLIGKPDLVLRQFMLAIFVDGDFWHGYKWKLRRPKLRNNRKYWIEKIEGNIKRDKKISRILKKQGWTVLRFWEHDIMRNTNKCITKVNLIIGESVK